MNNLMSSLRRMASTSQQKMVGRWCTALTHPQCNQLKKADLASRDNGLFTTDMMRAVPEKDQCPWENSLALTIGVFGFGK